MFAMNPTNEIDSTDPVTRFIITLVPIIVSECSKRIHISSASIDARMEVVDAITTDLIRECTFNENVDCLTPIQTLKCELDEQFDELKEDLTNEIKSAVKTELAVELTMYIDSLMDKKAAPVCQKAMETIPSVGVSTFTISSTAPNINLEQAISDSLGKQAVSAEEMLANNPLYARVTRGLERSQTGKSMYSPEELISARGDRMDAEHKDLFRQAVTKADFRCDSSSSAEDQTWDRLISLRNEQEY